jgi:RNA polymerase sigma factor (sigma-70 family)
MVLFDRQLIASQEINSPQSNMTMTMAYDVAMTNAPIDSELVERCLKGDETAWTLLIDRYQRLIYSVARALCQDPDDTADVFQSTCLDLYKGLADLRDVKALPAWLITVTRRRAIAVLKARIPIPAVEEPEPPASLDVVGAIEREHALELALDQCPERCRELINLLYFNANQPSYVDISEKLGIPVASIGPTRARCLDKLRKLLG